MYPYSLFYSHYASCAAKHLLWDPSSVWKKTVTNILWYLPSYRDNYLVESKYYELQKILRRTLRILLVDGRLIEGRLQVETRFLDNPQCFDSALNLIFVNAYEIISGTPFYSLFESVDSHLVHPIGRLIVPASEVRQFQVSNWTWSEERAARTQHRTAFIHPLYNQLYW